MRAGFQPKEFDERLFEFPRRACTADNGTMSTSAVNAPLGFHENFAMIRKELLQSTPERHGMPPSQNAHGVLLDSPTDNGIVSVVGLANGDTVLHLSYLSELIGCGVNPSVKSRIKLFIQACSSFHQYFTASVNLSIPESENARIHILKNCEAFYIDASRAFASDAPSGLSDIFIEGQAILADVFASIANAADFEQSIQDEMLSNLRRYPASESICAVMQVCDNPGNYSPPVLLETSQVLWLEGRDADAVSFFFRGWLRTSLDCALLEEINPNAAAAGFDMFRGHDELRKAIQSVVTNEAAVLRETLQWDARYPRAYDRAWPVHYSMPAICADLEGISHSIPQPIPFDIVSKSDSRMRAAFALGRARE